jgi:hypothetical protein
LAEAIHGNDAGSGLSGWAGAMGGSPAFQITGIIPGDRRSGFLHDEFHLYRVMQEYWVFFTMN